MTKSRVKWESLVLSRADFWMVWRCHGIPCFHFYVFCVEPNARKNNLMKATSVTFMTIFSEVSFWKLLDHSYVPSSFSTISINIENGNWKTPYSWKSFRILINTRANSFLGKHHETKIDEETWKIISSTNIGACTSKSIVLK